MKWHEMLYQLTIVETVHFFHLRPLVSLERCENLMFFFCPLSFEIRNIRILSISKHREMCRSGAKSIEFDLYFYSEHLCWFLEISCMNIISFQFQQKKKVNGIHS